MKKIMIITIIITLAIMLIACGPSKLDTKKAQIIGQMLKVNNVSYTAISSNGDKAEIIYESSEANKYDAQMVYDWGMIFASAANFGYNEIIIVNTINYMPAAKLTTDSENVKALGNGEINESVFWENVRIEAVD
ncbi:MAG: hypothetical protein V1866_00350 [archaeon]